MQIKQNGPECIPTDTECNPTILCLICLFPDIQLFQ